MKVFSSQHSCGGEDGELLIDVKVSSSQHNCGGEDGEMLIDVKVFSSQHSCGGDGMERFCRCGSGIFLPIPHRSVCLFFWESAFKFVSIHNLVVASDRKT